MKRKILLSSFFAAIIILAAAPIAAKAATSFEFYPTKINVKAGDYFTVTVRINPNGQKNYTVKASIKFPPDLLSALTWKYANVWMPLRKGSYDASSNTDGVIVRTAGYPEGFDKITTFGTVTFLAKKSGQATINFSGENLSLDENNTNQFSGSVPAKVIISAKPAAPVAITATTTATTTEVAPAIEEVTTEMQAPEQLFDINLELDHVNAAKAEDVGARAFFMSFGNVATPVNLTFEVINDKNQVVFVKQNDTVVETEAVVNADLSGANLSPGNYVLRLTTLYNTDVRDEFTQPFKIIAPETKAPICICWYLLAASILIAIIIIIILLRRRNRGPKNYYPGASVHNHQ